MGKNEKIYKLYRMFGYDYLFYSTIIFLFVTITKNISVGQYMYLCSIYAIFFAIFQIPLNYVVESLGLKKSNMLGNFCLIIHILFYIFFKQFIFLAIAEVFCALGFALKGLTETQLLYASLKKTGRTSKFAKLEGKCVSRYYYLEAIGSIFIGYLFTINSYIPICLTLTTVIISFIISTRFEDIHVDLSSDYSGIKSYLKGFKKILKSQRLISIFIFAFFMTGFIEVVKTLQKSVIVELQFSPTIYTIIMALLTLCVGIGSRMQEKAEKITKRKTLTIVSLIISLSVVTVGLVNSFSTNMDANVLVSVLILSLFNLFQGIYRISVKKYLNNFTTSDIRGKILAIFYIFEGLGRSLLLFISGIIVDNIGTNSTCIYSGITIFVIVGLILKFMKTRLGLDPNEYNKSDLCGKTPSELTK